MGLALHIWMDGRFRFNDAHAGLWPINCLSLITVQLRIGQVIKSSENHA